MKNTPNFEALIEAIQASSQPAAELASMLKDHFTPVVPTKLRDIDLNKVLIGDEAFKVESCDVYDQGITLTLEYEILKEIKKSAECMVLSKGMLLDYEDRQFELDKVIISQDIMIVTFSLNCDKVLIS